WQREQIAGPELEKRLAYWTDRLKALPRLSAFPTDRPRPVDSVGVGSAYDFEWTPDLYAAVRALARETDSTTYMVLLAAMAVVLTRNTGQADVAIGSPIGTRQLSELEGMLGPIINPLVLRFNLADDPPFASVVQRARDEILDGHQHQDVPFEALVQALKPERSFGHSPLFQVAVVLHNAPNAGASRIYGGGAIYDLTVYAVERGGAMTGSIEYRSDLYDRATIGRINSQLQALLTAASQDAQQRVSALPLLTADETETLLATLNPAPVEIDRTSVVEQFARVAAANPLNIAVISNGGTMMFAELHRRSSAVAQALTAAGAGRGSIVALACDRSIAMVVGALGILKAGAAYLPVDISYPANRVAFMLSNSGTQHVVATDEVLSSLKGITLPTSVIRVDQLAEFSGNPDDVIVASRSDDLAYLIYTSGSTGTPKGVRIPHRALSNFLGAMRERPGITAHDAVLNVTSLSFDISVLEVFLPLVSGARTIIASREQTTDGVALATLIKTAKATIIQSTPSGYRLLMHARWEGGPGITAIVGGETLPRDVAEWLCQRVGRVFNAYGPTETTVWSTLAELLPGAPVTVGSPVANTWIYVLDSAGHPTPIGVPGEIFIGGDGVADGYHGQKALTETQFVPDPFRPGRTMYRSGDYGFWRADRQLDHMGRLDGQVKLRGYRIETGEIESALLGHEMVRAAVVAVRDASAIDPRLVAWVQLKADGDCTTSELRRALRQTLPEFMIPSIIMFVDAVPMTPNNKIDRSALPEPYMTAPLTPREFVAPSTPNERVIAEIWSEMLGVPQVGTTDGFFELGGHSLLAMQAANRISKRTGRNIEPRLLFFRTLGQLAAECDVPANASNNTVLGA
ncbi:MAG: amino acid adenylation domain-containing protein, partial [Gemmatimonadaceae bacterium]